MGLKKLLESYFLNGNTVLNFFRIAVFLLVSFNPVQAQTVSISADRDGFEGGDTGRFLITVSNIFFGSDNINIKYTVSGTAVAGVDFIDLPEYDADNDIYEISVAYGGQETDSEFIVINVIDEDEIDGDKTLTVTLLPDDDNYTLGTDAEATITLFDNDECPTTAPVLDGGQSTQFCDNFSVNLNNFTNTAPRPMLYLHGVQIVIH